jgi:protein-tyrosine-phosphatase
MLEIVIAYLSYNIVLGILLGLVQLIRSGTNGSVRNWLLLILFPAVGLGYMRFAETNLKNGIPELPEKWFMWKYMTKVNWGFLLIIAFFPAILIILSSIGLIAAGTWNMNAQGIEGLPEMDQLLGFGMVMLGIFYIIVMFFLLIIPYLILIYIPKSQAKSIERKRMHEMMMQQKQSKAKAEPAKPVAKRIPLYDAIETYVEAGKAAFDDIPKERKKNLEQLADFISKKRNEGDTVNLMFICTHNSRRSQFGQIWAAVAAAHYGIRNIQTFSGGTEETAFNKRAVEAIQRAGLKVDGTVSTNPRYSVRFSDEVGALDCYSKTFHTSANPQKGFMAIMTCSDADEACPIVAGADLRIRITYDDPKVADRTAQEKDAYDERCKQIATEMLYLFSKVA